MPHGLVRPEQSLSPYGSETFLGHRQRIHGRWLIVHNRFIDGFAAIKPDLVLAVDESLFPEIKSQSDTEVLFYLALTFGLERTIRRMLARAIAIDADRLPSHPKLIEDAVRLRSGHPRQGVRLPAFVRGGFRAFALIRYGHP